MTKQWVFAFIGGRFDGYRHVADPEQCNARQKPPDELHLWEEAIGCIRLREDPDDVPESAERYCLRGINRAGLEAHYEHEGIHTEGGGELVAMADMPLAPPEREPGRVGFPYGARSSEPIQRASQIPRSASPRWRVRPHRRIA